MFFHGLINVNQALLELLKATSALNAGIIF